MARLKVTLDSHSETPRGLDPVAACDVGDGFAQLIKWEHPPGFSYEIDVVPNKGQIGQIPHPMGCVVINGSQTCWEPDGTKTKRVRGYVSPEMIDAGTWRFKTGPEGVEQWSMRIHGEYLKRTAYHVKGTKMLDPAAEECARYLVVLSNTATINGQNVPELTEVIIPWNSGVVMSADDSVVVEFQLMEA